MLPATGRMTEPMMKSALVLAALSMPAAAQPPDPLCADLGRVVAAAREAEPFASVTAAESWSRFALFELCRPNRLGPVDRVACSWRLASAAPVVEGLAARAAACLPRAMRRDDDAAARFRLDGLSIHIGQEISAPGSFSDGAFVVVLLDGE